MSLYGIFQDSKHKLTPEEDKEFSSKGFLSLKNVLSSGQVSKLTENIYKYLKVQENEAAAHGLDLASLNESDLLRCPLAYDRSFYEALCLNPKVLKYVNAVLGDNVQIHLQNAIINRPVKKHHQSNWHRDIPYQPFLPSRPMSVGVLYCLSPFNIKTGGTFYAPGSHKFHDGEMTEETLEALKVCPSLEAGDAVLFDSFVWHRAGLNQSSEDRIGVNNMFTTPILKQQISIPDLLPPGYCQTENDNKLLGVQWQEPRSVNAFRLKRVKK